MSSVDAKQRSGGGVGARGGVGDSAGQVRLGALFDQASASLHQAVAALEPECLSGGDAKVLYGAVVDVLRMATAAKLSLATRIESSGIWKESGHRNAASLIAETEGVGVGRARSTLETGKALVDAPKTAEALRDGKLSEDQVKELAGAIAVAPGTESELVDAAQGGESLTALRDRCRRTKARAAGADPDKTLARIHADRHLSHWTDEQGAFCLKGRFTPDRGAQLLAVLDKATQDRFEAARKDGDRAPMAAYRADAFVELLCGDSAPTARPRTIVNVRVDQEVLFNREARGDELCCIDGIGDVPVRTVESLLSDSFLKVLFTKGTKIDTVSHPGRYIDATIRTALVNTYPHCVVPGCESTSFLEIDHVQPVSEQGPTRFSNLVRICHFHHDKKTNAGYVLHQDAEGHWHFDPPPPFGQEPDLGGGLYDPELCGAKTTNPTATTPKATGSGTASGWGADPPGSNSKPRTGPRQRGSGRRAASDNDADPGEPPPLFELGQ